MTRQFYIIHCLIKTHCSKSTTFGEPDLSPSSVKKSRKGNAHLEYSNDDDDNNNNKRNNPVFNF